MKMKNTGEHEQVYHTFIGGYVKNRINKCVIVFLENNMSVSMECKIPFGPFSGSIGAKLKLEHA